MCTVPYGLDQISNSNHDSILDENDVSYFNDDGFIHDPTASGSGLQAGDSRFWRQLDGRIWRAPRLRLSRTAPTKIRRPRIQISHRNMGISGDTTSGGRARLQ